MTDYDSHLTVDENHNLLYDGEKIGLRLYQEGNNKGRYFLTYIYQAPGENTGHSHILESLSNVYWDFYDELPNNSLSGKHQLEKELHEHGFFLKLPKYGSFNRLL